MIFSGDNGARYWRLNEGFLWDIEDTKIPYRRRALGETGT